MRDFLLSHDIEDIITVVDGNLLVQEVWIAVDELRTYVTEELGVLMNKPEFLDALAGPSSRRSREPSSPPNPSSVNFQN